MAALKLNIDSLKFSGSGRMEELKPSGPVPSVLSSKFKSQSPPSDLTTPKGYGRYEYRVFVIVENFLQPHSKISLEEASDSVIGIFPVGHLDLSPINSVCLELAEQIPYTHPSLVKLSRLLWMVGRNKRRIISSGQKVHILHLTSEITTNII